MLSQTILTCIVGFLASVASASILPRESSDTNTCGLQNAGENKGFTCGTTLWPCCGPSGFCGASDAYCLTTVGCQSGYSNTTGACYEPKNATTISPDNTCGNQNSGHFGYKCPSNRPCCGPSGFCGSSDAYCLTSVGCQGDFSNPESSCYKPTDGGTETPDNTCGKQAGQENGYRCGQPLRCCSQYGYCGNTTEFCEISNGCQRGYGFCVPNDA